MKLRLPLLLLASILACFVSSGFASTDLGGSTYSGGVYTWVGSNSANFHNGGWSQTTMNEGNISYGAINTNWGAATDVGSIWNLFANNNLSEYNTIRFVAEGTEIGEAVSVGANKQIDWSFSPLNIGGLLVESGATGYAINASKNDGRMLAIGKNSESVSLFTIQEDFTLRATASSLAGTGNWMIASGKTLSFDRTTGAGNNTNILTLSAGSKLNITGGGTVSLTGLAGSGGIHLNASKLALTTTTAGTLSNALEVTGTSELSMGADMIWSSVAMNDAASLKMSRSLIVNGNFYLKGTSSTIDGSLTLGTGSTLHVGMLPAANTSLLTVNSLSVGAGAALFINLDSDVTAGTSYDLVQWTTLAGTFASSVTLTGNFSNLYDAALVEGANSLSVIFQTKAGLLFWAGAEGAQWSQGGGNWLESGNSVNFNAGDKVVFKDNGLVNITGDVEPGSILFANGENTTVTFEGSGHIKGSGEIKISSPGTVVMATDNSDYSGEVILTDGVLEIRNANALGSTSTADITFEGGLLKYGSGIDSDLSTRAKGNVRLDLNGNNVNWLAKTGNTQTDIKEIHLLNSSGAAAALSTKVLPVDKISLAANTTLKLEVQTGGAYSPVGSVSGAGTMYLYGGTSVFAAAQNYLQFTSTADFTGTWVFDKFLIKEGLNLSALGGKKVIFKDCASTESRIYMGFGNAIINQDIELQGTGLTLSDGSSTGVVTFNGAFTGSGAFTKSNNNVGDVYKFLGNMSGYTGNVSYNHQSPGNGDPDRGLVFGEGSVAEGSDTAKIAGTGNIAITGTTLAYLTFNYGSADVTAVNSLSGMGVLTKLGAGKLILAKGSAMTEAMTLEGTLQLGVGSMDTAAVISASSITNNGTLVLNFSGVNGNETIMNQNITTGAGQTGNLVKEGADTVILGGSNTYNGTTTIKNGVLQLVRDNVAALGTSKILVEGGIFNMSATALTNDLSLTGGNILNAGIYAGADHSVTIADSTAGESQTSISLGNIGAEKIASLHLEKVGMSATKIGSALGNSQLSLQDSTLTFGALNMVHALTDPYPNSPSTLIQFENGQGSTVSMAAGSVLTLNLMDADLIVAMQGAGAGTQTFYLLLTNGKLDGITKQNLNFVQPGGVFEFVATDGGNVVISGDTSNIYAVASNQTKTIDSNSGLDVYNNVLINGTLNLNLPGVADLSDGLEIKNLSGKKNAVINVTSTGGGTASVILNVTDAGLKETYLGSINGGSANLTKTGEGTQVIGGEVTTTGNMSIKSGILELNGLARFGNLTTDNGSLRIGKEGETILSGAASMLNGGTSISGEGKLTINDHARLTLANGSSLDGVNVKLNGAGSALDLGTTTGNKISGLNGTGTLIGNAAEFAIETAAGQVNEYSGVLAGSGVMTVGGKGVQKLVGAGSNTWSLNLNGGSLHLLSGANNSSISYKSLNVSSGTVRISASGTTPQDVNPSVTLANGGSFASGSTLAFDINTDYPGVLTSSSSPFLRTEGLLTFANGVNIDVTSLDPKAMLPAGVEDSFSLLLVQVSGSGEIELEGALNLQTSGFFKVYFTDSVVELIDGNLVLSGQARQDNYFLPAATTYNSLAGAELFWSVKKGMDSKSQVGQLMNAVSNDIDSGNFASASRSMAASVGSTVTSLLASQRGDFRQQQLMIRNRTAQMGVNQGYINEDMPYFNAWVQGNGSYDKLNTSGDDSGYSLSTWGGTAGFDIDLNPALTVGAAFTASYGKLKAQAADTASGDMDSYYVNLFARLQQKKWSHTLIATGGWNDASLDRSVFYSGGGYSTQGDTSGSSIGVMYEGTYDIALNQKKTSIFQPLVNASILTSRVDGYSETGAGNASLSVDKMDATTGTIALGARLMGIVGTNLFGRGVLGEVRAQVSQDMGDDRAVGRVGYQGIPTNSVAIRGVKRGSTGVQLGAGVYLPVGQQGTIFADANTDIRSGATSVNGTIGYRYNF